MPAARITGLTRFHRLVDLGQERAAAEAGVPAARVIFRVLVDDVAWLVDQYRKGREQRSTLCRVTPVMPLAAPVVNGSFRAVGHAIRAQDECAVDRRPDDSGEC